MAFKPAGNSQPQDENYVKVDWNEINKQVKGGSRPARISLIVDLGTQEREDFKEEANKKFFRLKLGGEVRLKNAYFIKATSCDKDENGEITVIYCTYDPLTKSGMDTEESKRKVKGTLHWVSVKHAIKAEVRAYDRLFLDEAPDSHKDKDYMEFINPNSLEIITAFIEPSLQSAKIGERFQFQRLGYFNIDNDSTTNNLVFNKTVGLRDSWGGN